MKHVQTGRNATIEVRDAREKDSIALVITCRGMHSDVYVMPLAEMAPEMRAAFEAARAKKAAPAKEAAPKEAAPKKAAQKKRGR